VGWDWVHLVRRPLFGLLYQLRMIDDECRGVHGMRIGRGNRSTRREPVPVPLCPPQIPRDLTWDRTQAVAVGMPWLIAWAYGTAWQGLSNGASHSLSRSMQCNHCPATSYHTTNLFFLFRFLASYFISMSLSIPAWSIMFLVVSYIFFT
jgi:hypothetical protein